MFVLVCIDDTGLRFHFDSAAGSGYVQPCEAAYLASMDAVRGGKAIAPEVTVLVMYVSLSSSFFPSFLRIFQDEFQDTDVGLMTV